MASPDYDRHAAIYDRLIGSPLYNRLVWGTSTDEYSAFAREALASGTGPFLDAGCGTAVFTAEAYSATDRELVLTDLSEGMLARARERVPRAEHVVADLFALPFAPGRFGTVACFAMLHVLDEPWRALEALRPHVAPGGAFFASMLVADRRFGARYMKLLRRRGEFGPPRTEAELLDAAREVFGPGAHVTRHGSMAYLRAQSR